MSDEATNTKTIVLGCHGIVIVDYGNGVASISDELGDEYGSWRDMVDGITSMILAHYCAGVDVTSSQYIEGINTAIENCANFL